MNTPVVADTETEMARGLEKTNVSCLKITNYTADAIATSS
jgi:hypothetical protein